MQLASLLSFLLRPGDASRTEIARPRARREVAGTLAFLAVEAFVMGACIQYWWFGQLYPRSTAWLTGAILALSLVPTLHAPARGVPGTWVLAARVLSITTLVACGLIVAFRLGFTDPIDRYLYQSPLLVSLVLSFMIAFLVLKALHRRPHLGTARPSHRVALGTEYLVLDAVLMVAFVLFLLNFEGILALLP